ncbi:DUF551 domain-containing protein [Massilimaliae timonensis]|jgi:hypothetical protein|uniref:DUF551 domain-containing protein n=1 Tax=Massiliimalia timonensis TaxID=1987501 RepID=A0A8J6P6R9_9FIRM|nr:DUF551 domain-containing protein [Massiliimalia timonensis]MBC8612093.1 DUF551 domain-containing protein [Massiliimalia timonensis]
MRLIDADALDFEFDRRCFSEEDENYVRGVDEAIGVVKNAPTINPGEWISVKDRLPEPFISVLCYMPGEQPFPTVHEGFVSNNGIWHSNYFNREPGEVTHWMPLPQPPEEG